MRLARRRYHAPEVVRRVAEPYGEAYGAQRRLSSFHGRMPSAGRRGGTASPRQLDRCSPPVFTALVNREWITRVEIRLFDKQGIHFFTIKLENAVATRISRVVRSRGLHEEVAFAYRAIQLIDERTGVSASHDFGG